MNFTNPAEIPISETEPMIVTKLLIAEKTPKSETDKPLAATKVKTKAKNEEIIFPPKSI